MRKIKKIVSLLLVACIFMLSLGIYASAATIVTPTVTLNSISNRNVNTTVTVTGSATRPCYRMAAKYVHNGTTTWLGEVYSNSYSKSFKVTTPGTYTVTLYARSYPETDSRSGNGSKSVTFTVYGKVTPTITLTSIPAKKVGDTVTVKATATTPCYRMYANYVINGTTHGLGEVSGSSYSKSFMVQETGTYTVNVYARSYAESDPRSDRGSRSTSFTATAASTSATLSVPLYAQPTFDTCGPTSVSMVLAKYGVSKSPESVRDYIKWEIAGDFEHHETLAKALANLLGSKNPGYTAYKFENSRTSAEHLALVKKNIDAGVPVIPLLGFSAESGGFPYGSVGHYVVIKGYSGSTLVINDPYSGTVGTSAVRNISNNKMKRYLEGENPYIICARQ